jgi:hypothetical protein
VKILGLFAKKIFCSLDKPMGLFPSEVPKNENKAFIVIFGVRFVMFGAFFVFFRGFSINIHHETHLAKLFNIKNYQSLNGQIFFLKSI